MACESNIYNCNEMLPSAKRMCVDTSTEMTEKLLNCIDDNATPFEDLSYESENDKNILNEFFINWTLPTVNSAPSVEEVQPAITSSPKCKVRKNSDFNALFQQDLGSGMFLSLRLRKKIYSVYINEINHDVANVKEASSKRLIMDLNSWYEFQYKVIAFNLKYKNSSFVANNTIIVLNVDNYIMRIKHLNNFFHVDLNDEQLQSLKNTTAELNKVLLEHMYGKHIPDLIKRKCPTKHMIQEETQIRTLFKCVEENLVTIISKRYECIGCISGESYPKNLHMCTALSNREKYEQLGVNILMLVNIDFIVNTFINRIYCISESFLSDITLEDIYNVLFK